MLSVFLSICWRFPILTSNSGEPNLSFPTVSRIGVREIGGEIFHVNVCVTKNASRIPMKIPES